MAVEAAEAAAANEISNSLLGGMIGYVREVAGEDGVGQVLARAGEERTAAEIEADPAGWSSYRQVLAVFQAAAAILGDPDVGRKVGAFVLRRYRGTEAVSLLRSFGSPAELLKVYPAISAKQSAITQSEVVEVGDRHAVVAIVSKPGIKRDPLFCGYTLGGMAEWPVLFGMNPGEVEELECQTRGDPRCLVKITWDPTSSVQQTLEEELSLLRDQVASLTGRYHELETVATELASAGDVQATLETITRHALKAVRAPRFLLAVRLPRDATWRIHHVGFAEEEVAGAADQLMKADADADHDACIVVEVASAQAHFGRLAAYYPPGFPFFPHERALLAAYAGHAAAALETAAALGEARERNQTLGALLALGTALSEAASAGEVAQRLVDALVGVLRCDEAHVLLWDDGDATLSRLASAGPGLLRRALPPAQRLRDPLVMAQLTVMPGPTVVSPMSDPVARQVVGLVGLDAAMLVPILSRGKPFGVAVAAWEGAPDASEAARERLAGIASLAATALNGAELLDDARHQALHDPLTELANPRLFEDRLNHAVAQARRTGQQLAVLFLDLDHFKVVNDTHGHSAGDELLRAVAGRLRATVRREDTVARMGGDEFAILLQRISTADAERMAGHLIDFLEEPFSIHGVTVNIGASVGITVLPQGDDSYGSVVRRADTAMYQAKAAGRGCYRLAEVIPDRPPAG